MGVFFKFSVPTKVAHYSEQFDSLKSPLFQTEAWPSHSSVKLTSRQSSLGRCGVLTFLTYLCEHQARLAHYLAGLKDGLEAIGSSWQLVCWYDSDGLRHSVHRAIKLFPPGLLHFLWSPAHSMLQTLSWKPHLGVDRVRMATPIKN